MTAACNSKRNIENGGFIGASLPFPVANAKSADIFLLENVDQRVHTKSLYMSQRTNEIPFSPSIY